MSPFLNGLDFDEEQIRNENNFDEDIYEVVDVT